MGKLKMITLPAILVLIAACVLAVSHPPEAYWGYVYIEGEPAPDNSNITIESASGEFLAFATVPAHTFYKSSYSISIPFDDPATSFDEGAVSSQQVVWKVNGIKASSPKDDTAVSGKSNNNFTIHGIYNPSVTLKASVPLDETPRGASISLSLMLNNSGKGNATVKINDFNMTSLSATQPADIRMPKNSTASIEISLVPRKCMLYSFALSGNYLNANQDVAGNFSDRIEFRAKGPDLIVKSANIPKESYIDGDRINISAVIANEGRGSSQEYNVSFSVIRIGEYPSGEVSLSSNKYHLLPGKNTTFHFPFDTSGYREGEYKASVSVKTAEAECDSSNNMAESAGFTIRPFETAYARSAPTGMFILNAGSGSSGISTFIWILITVLLSIIIIYLALTTFPSIRQFGLQKESPKTGGISSAAKDEWTHAEQSPCPAKKMPQQAKVDEKGEEQNPVQDIYLPLSSITKGGIGKEKEKSGICLPVRPIDEQKKTTLSLNRVEKLADISPVLDSLRSGYTIPFIMPGKSLRRDPEELRKVVSRLKRGAFVVNATLYSFKDGSLIVIPPFAELVVEKKKRK